MARRRSVGPGVSFFAFQDIITAVVGIFILVTLLLVLELAQRVETAGEKKICERLTAFGNDRQSGIRGSGSQRKARNTFQTTCDFQ